MLPGKERKKTEGAGPEGEIQEFGCGLSATKGRRLSTSVFLG